jgi:hypothetical protein
MFLRGTPLTAKKLPPMTTLPSLWVALARTKPPAANTPVGFVKTDWAKLVEQTPRISAIVKNK